MQQHRRPFKMWVAVCTAMCLTMFSRSAGMSTYADSGSGTVASAGATASMNETPLTTGTAMANADANGLVAQDEHSSTGTSSLGPPNATDIASQAKITFLQVTGTPDEAFAQMERKYRPAGNSLSIPGKWAGFCRQGGRNITFSLGGQQNVTYVSLSFEQNSKGGIYWPPSMEVLISTDAHTWYALDNGEVNTRVQGDVKTFTVTPPSPVQARYIKIIFPVRIWVFAGELHIWAVNETGSLPGQVGTPIVPRPSNPSQGLLTSNSTDGARHILLVYTGDHGQLGEWSVQDFLPMLEYIDPNGSAESQMFDTLLFLPYSDAGDTAAGWLQYLDDLFGRDGEFAHLNSAAEEVGRQVFSAQLVKVIFTVPYPDPGQKKFGAVSNGGPNLDFSASDVGETQALQNRETAIQWYYDEFMRRWKEANYPHLKLIGVYWDKETDPSSDQALIQWVHNLASKDNLFLLWIPAYGTTIGDWNNMGFDGAILQSNYYETENATLQRVENTVDTAEQRGLGLEIELDGRVFTNMDMAARYRGELQSFALALPPSANAVLVFYDASKVLLQAYKSINEAERSIYDETGTWLMAH
ncbi:MAG: DUF4855 domain-containing protein [Alicyclobacillus sp.]|nr:DUF4855 domain-containing protein [Alicyclobacillus sp.]